MQVVARNTAVNAGLHQSCMAPFNPAHDGDAPRCRLAEGQQMGLSDLVEVFSQSMSQPVSSMMSLALLLSASRAANLSGQGHAHTDQVLEGRRCSDHARDHIACNASSHLRGLQAHEALACVYCNEAACFLNAVETCFGCLYRACA